MFFPKSPRQTLFMEKPEEAEKIRQLANLLREEDKPIKLVNSQGVEAIIPDTVYHLLLTCVRILADGKALTLGLHSRDLTTQQAADILGVSLPFLIKLLDRGEIHYKNVDSYGIITFEDVMKYAKKREQQREKKLDELIQMTEEAGLYELDEKLS